MYLVENTLDDIIQIRTIIPSSPETNDPQDKNDNTEEKNDDDEDDEDEDDEDDKSLTTVISNDVANPFQVQSGWCLESGESVSQRLFNSGLARLRQVKDENRKMTPEERYCVTLALSCILEPSCSAQLEMLTVDTAARTVIYEQATQKLKVEIPEIKAMKNTSVKKIIRLCQNGSFNKARSTVKKVVADMIDQLDEIDEVEVEEHMELQIVLQIFEFILDRFSFDPNSLTSSSRDEPPTEGEYVHFVKGIFEILVQGISRVRIGELKAKNTDKRRKVDLTITRDGTQVSHSEFARKANAGTKKWWSDRSKTLRLNQQISNDCKAPSVAFQITKTDARLLVLQHIDDGLYLANVTNSFSFPQQKEEIVKTLPALLSNLFYFRKQLLQNFDEFDSQRMSISDDCIKIKKSFIVQKPFWTDRRKGF
ncbi:hypothetical protein HK096_010956 [Nowakowskiella sp. JEL0078]|nr:hypothetical protein HK096_010956 [Nowakowskiella sp. JEL0078]